MFRKLPISILIVLVMCLLGCQTARQTAIDISVEEVKNAEAMREIAKKVHRSERTVRRYVKRIEPHVELRTDLDSIELMDWFFDKVLSQRRWITAQASDYWKEEFDLGVEAVDSTFRLLRARLEAMDEVTVMKLRTDESLRRQFFKEFVSPVIIRWARGLNTVRVQKMLDRELGPDGMMRAVDQLADMGVFHLALGGGESFELDWLFDIARHIR